MSWWGSHEVKYFFLFRYFIIYIYTYIFHNPWYIHQTTISVFLLLNLPAAEATLVIEASGFRPSRRGFLVLEVLSTAKINKKLVIKSWWLILVNTCYILLPEDIWMWIYMGWYVFMVIMVFGVVIMFFQDFSEHHLNKYQPRMRI
jgi:hypothetical protein